MSLNSLSNQQRHFISRPIFWHVDENPACYWFPIWMGKLNKMLKFNLDGLHDVASWG